VETEVSCPYCGETATLWVDPSGGEEQEYVEDCPVCCRPWLVRAGVDEQGCARAVLAGYGG